MNTDNYQANGFLHLKNFFSTAALLEIEALLEQFHQNWLEENKVGFQSGLINSHSITSSSFLSKQQRLALFQFVSQEQIINVVKKVFPNKAILLNTQLFFDPLRAQQANYWHRDIQYTGMEIADQQQSLTAQNVIHFRIPFRAERGIELIPKSHVEWDLPEELETRLSLNGRKPSDDLQRGKQLELQRGDLLVFSANMIHRGIYGKNRFSLDVVFCDDSPEFYGFIDRKNLPTASELSFLNPVIF